MASGANVGEAVELEDSGATAFQRAAQQSHAPVFAPTYSQVHIEAGFGGVQYGTVVELQPAVVFNVMISKFLETFTCCRMPGVPE
jgi:hypothetical protein